MDIREDPDPHSKPDNSTVETKADKVEKGEEEEYPSKRDQSRK